MQKSLRDKAAQAARQYGFSSVQEVTRVLLKRFVEHGIDISFSEPVVKLSKSDDFVYDLEQASVADYFLFEEGEPSAEELDYYHSFVQ